MGYRIRYNIYTFKSRLLQYIMYSGWLPVREELVFQHAKQT